MLPAIGAMIELGDGHVVIVGESQLRCRSHALPVESRRY